MHKWILSILIGLASVLAAYLLLFQLPKKEEAAPEETVEIPDTPVDVAQAESIYKSNCMSCHGDQYQGNIGPALVQVGATMKRESIYKKISHGGGGMPPFEGTLPEEDIVNLTNWLAGFK